MHTIKFRFLLSITFFFFFSLMASGQVSTPNVISFGKSDYQAGRQNWDIDIDKDGIVYFGNSDGLLTYNHGEWKLYPLPSQSAIRSLKVIGDTLWVGGKEYGYFLKEEGDLTFHSLGVLEFRHVWKIETDDENIIFQLEDKFVVYNLKDRSSNILEYFEGISTMTKWRGRIWAVMKTGKIGCVFNNTFNIKHEFQELYNREVRRLFQRGKDLYILLYDGQLYRYNGKELTEVRLPETLKGKVLFAAIPYNNESYCIGTVTEGFVMLDTANSIINDVNTSDGLLDNTILSMKRDKMGNVWLGLDYGIAKVELQSAISKPFRGAATFSVVDYKDKEYLATNKGLFISKPYKGFELEKRLMGHIWNLKNINEELFICYNGGLYVFDGEKYTVILDHTGVLDVAQYGNTNRYLVSTYKGLKNYLKLDGQYLYVSDIDLWGEAKLINDKENECIWVNIPDSDVVQLKIAADFTVDKKVCYGIKKAYDINNEIVFTDGKRFKSYQNGKFSDSKNNLLKEIEASNIDALIQNENRSVLAYIQNDEVKLIEQLSDGNIHSYNSLLKSLGKDLNNESKFIDIQDNTLRVATDRGVTYFKIKHQNQFERNDDPVISSIEVVGTDHRKNTYPFNDKKLTFSAKENNLKFDLFTNKYTSDIVEYRYKLSDAKEWSSWGEWNDGLLLSNLRGGEYTLLVQNRINDGKINEVALPFTINKVWYQSTWVILPMSLLFILFNYILYRINKYFNEKKLQVQKENLEQENAKELLELKQEQLLQYMEIINRKDAFLSKVKTGLDKMRNNESNKWSAMIEEEIHQERKDVLFSNLFTEVQQDFIKNITEAYPKLTANDIRILSFIRINLSNREISNLMNITPRSLDTSRYRLRKKINLEQGEDLNKFIREF
ncbi:helix-turn-helix and ligand-binding sensor domain-containing protein [Flammeovirga aprica]|uniref:HTH luxR-type domain-containing protein n=1 Tax=Flammeovirga aprica JL-4 TaxID=694437 RepID=A0A7X9RRQ1_9BACT|nr:hypothetical protein [Flammeovirga aprica]NME68118.1 hypothetical protein [Flammeovirga aprica JL-4]